jgi:hypothetical protein
MPEKKAYRQRKVQAEDRSVRPAEALVNGSGTGVSRK